MSISHNVDQRNTFATSITTAVDGGLGVGNCVLKAGTSVVATIPLNKPSFGAPAAGIITLVVSPVPEDDDAAGNASVVDSMEFQDSDGTVIFTGSNITAVGGGGDLELSKNPIAAGDIVQLTSFSYQASP